MDIIKRSIIFAALLTLLVITHASEPPRAYACSCEELLPPDAPQSQDQIESYDAVFTGKVISVKEDVSNSEFLMSRAAVFEVMSVWKGVTQTQIIVHTGRGGGDCGLDFQLNSTWLVYASEWEDKPLRTGLCDRTMPLSSDRANEVLALLGEGKAPTESVNLASPGDLARYLFVNQFIPILISISILFIGALLVLRQRKREKDPNY